MSLRSSPWPPGVPCWVDLAVSDVEAVRSFYTAVLGWDFVRSDAGADRYLLARARGVPAAGVGIRQPGAPTAWTLSFASDDVDATASAVVAAGGTVVAPPRDVGRLGRTCVAADPTGAAFGVWQHADHIGAGVVNEPGGLTWDDLRSPDPNAARAFYTEVFGFTTTPLPAAGPDYAVYQLPQEVAPLGGMGGMFGAAGQLAHWLVYFGVADAAAAADAADRSGGSVVVREFDTPYGPMASLLDPAGAAFWVIETDGSNQPDRSG